MKFEPSGTTMALVAVIAILSTLVVALELRNMAEGKDNMITATMLMLEPHIGFYGLHGFFGALLGLFLCIVIIWGIWEIFKILTAKFASPETSWLFQIFRVILIVCTVVFFVNAIFGLGWW